MRIGILAAAALALTGLGSSAARAQSPDPAIVFQAHPFGRVLDELRGAAGHVAGEKGVKAVNRGIKDGFGDKGFDGLDITRPIVGYVLLAPKPQDITAVVALPVTTEKDFIDLCERANKRKVTPFGKAKDVYELPPLQPGRGYTALLRFADGYAYIAYGLNPAPAIDPKALVPMPRLYDPAEKGLIAARLHFDRIPLNVKLAAPVLLGEVKKAVLAFFDLGHPRDEWFEKAITPEVEKLAARYVKLLPGADTLTARLNVDPAGGNLVLEAVLAPKANSELATGIAAWKQTGNKFAALAAGPDAAIAVKGRLPLFEEEIRAAVAAAAEAGAKEAAKNPPPGAAKGFVDELLKGVARTAKKGDVDFAGAIRGPDKNGHFTAVGVIAFDDPAAMEKELKTFVQADTPREVQNLITWDAAKAGAVSIHTVKIPNDGFIKPGKVFGGDDCKVAFAFAPHGAFGAIGPDAVNTLKDALAVKPTDAPVLDVAINPARVRQFIRKLAPNDAEAMQVEGLFGQEDKLGSVASVTLAGGKELTARLTLDLRVLPRLMFQRDIERAERRAEAEEIGPPPKK